MPDYTALDRYIEERMPSWTEELVEFCRFRSESGDLEGLRGAADWIAERLGRLGASVDVVELPGDPDVPPLVVGEIGDGPRTLNAVQHYDVQPSVPLDLWTTPPYEPTVRDGRLYARGATDNKGELLPRVWAIEAYLATIGPLPCRVRFLVEGEEEYGSGHLDALLDRRPGIRQVEGALIEGGGVDLTGRPEIVGGVRGIVVLELVCRTIAYDAHSSMATVLPSAPVRMAQALASFYSTDGVPVVVGLDKGIRAPTAAQLAIVDATPVDIVDEIRTEYQIPRLLGGLDGTAAIRAMTFVPTLNIQGLWSGFIGPGDKTITPAEAHARLDIRIVPDQDPADIVAAIREHLGRGGFSDIEIVGEESEPAYWTRADDPMLDAATRVSESVFDMPSVRYVSMPGVAPMWQVCGRDNIPMTSLGGGRSDCRAHAPDENVHLGYAAKAAQLTARFLDEFAAIPEPTGS
jgi:acetylornithine deacetylase/succinyl-diaminopimelate desuccinylase-like protein